MSGTREAEIERRLKRAQASAAAGRIEEARRQYLAVLAEAPSHLGALNDLGTLLHDADYRSAARTCYAEAVRHHPDAAMPRVNLANLLLDDGEIAEARLHYEAALARAPDFAEAHQGLARVLAELGEDEAAARHRAQGFRERFLVERPFRGEGEGVPLLVLVASAGGNVPTRFLIDDKVYRTTIAVADFFDRARPLPDHAAVFNAIGDADLVRAALEAAEALLARSSAPILNPPRAVAATGRVDNARRMAGLAGVIVPRIARFALRDLAVGGAEILRREGFGFPLLLRRPGFHTGRYFVRVETAGELAQAVSTMPGADVLAIEYLDAEDGDGMFRKYRVMAVDGMLYPMHLAIAPLWKVHYFTAGMEQGDARRAEEARFLADMVGAIGPVAVAALGRVAGMLGLDYGGIDFALDGAGNVLLFEANATMAVNPPEPDPRWDYRRTAVARVRAAVATMLARRAGGTSRAINLP
jgi:hypothetical protein